MTEMGGDQVSGIEEAITRLEQERTALHDQRAPLQTRLAALDERDAKMAQAIELLRELGHPSTTQTERELRPTLPTLSSGRRRRRGTKRGRPFLRRLLAERREWTMAEIKAAAAEKGSPSSGKAIENLIHSMRADGEVEKVGRLGYRLAQRQEAVAA